MKGKKEKERGKGDRPQNPKTVIFSAWRVEIPSGIFVSQSLQVRVSSLCYRPVFDLNDF
jgi:hypothetical protein